MRYLILLLLLCQSAYADTVVLERSTVVTIQEQLQRLKAIEQAKPVITMDGFTVNIDDHGNATTPDTISLNVGVADLKWRGEADVRLNVHKSVRYKRGLGVTVDLLVSNQIRYGFGINYNMFTFNKWTVGAGVGVSDQKRAYIYPSVGRLILDNTELHIGPYIDWKGHVGGVFGIRVGL